MCCDGNYADVGGDKMLFETLKRAIIRGNYTSKKDMADKLSLLYSADKIKDEEFMALIELLWEGGEE